MNVQTIQNPVEGTVYKFRLANVPAKYRISNNTARLLYLSFVSTDQSTDVIRTAFAQLLPFTTSYISQSGKDQFISACVGTTIAAGQYPISNITFTTILEGENIEDQVSVPYVLSSSAFETNILDSGWATINANPSTIYTYPIIDLEGFNGFYLAISLGSFGARIEIQDSNTSDFANPILRWLGTYNSGYLTFPRLNRYVRVTIITPLDLPSGTQLRVNIRRTTTEIGREIIFLAEGFSVTRQVTIAPNTFGLATMPAFAPITRLSLRLCGAGFTHDVYLLNGHVANGALYYELNRILKLAIGQCVEVEVTVHTSFWIILQVPALSTGLTLHWTAKPG